MKNTVLLLVLASVFMMGITAPQISFAQTSPDSNGHCGVVGLPKIEFTDGDTTATYQASGSGTITTVYIKAGSESSEGGCTAYTADVTEGCYLIQGIGTGTVTITENLGEGNECKDVSHVEFFVQDPIEEVVTPTPSATPSAEPTATPTPAPTATPTPGSSTNTGGTSNGGSTNTSSTPSVEQKRGQVLGASTLANTGNPFVSAGIVLQVVGTLLTGVSLRRYGKNK